MVKKIKVLMLGVLKSDALNIIKLVFKMLNAKIFKTLVVNALIDERMHELKKPKLD